VFKSIMDRFFGKKVATPIAPATVDGPVEKPAEVAGVGTNGTFEGVNSLNAPIEEPAGANTLGIPEIPVKDPKTVAAPAEAGPATPVDLFS